MIPLSVPEISGKEWQYVKECLDTGWVSSVGSYVTRFETQIAAYVGIPHAVACVNGTAALHIALLLSGVGYDDEVIVPTLTFIAPVNVVRYVGAHPVFMDCDDHLNLDAAKLDEFLATACHRTERGLINTTSGRRIGAIVVVHVFGHPAQMPAITALAERYALKVIEDATESLGAYYPGAAGGEPRFTGTLGDFGCLSFNGNKLITTGGGGMLLVRDPAMAERARYLTTQAKDDAVRFVHHAIGYNYRLTNVLAAIGCAQLERIQEFIARKRENFSTYQTCLQDIPGLAFIAEPPYARSNYWHYTLMVDEREYGSTAEALQQKLAAHAIETRPIWELNHRQIPYRACQAYKIERAPEYHRKGLNLPCSVNLDPTIIPEICRWIAK